MWSAESFVDIYRSDQGRTLEPILGVIVDQSESVLLSCVVDNLGFPNGFAIVRSPQVVSVDVNPKGEFYASLFKINGYPYPASPIRNIESFNTVMEELALEEEVSSFHFELKEPGALYLGRIKAVWEGGVTVQCFKPTGGRYAEVDSYAIKDCTRIDFGGVYERGYAQYDNLICARKHLG